MKNINLIHLISVMEKAALDAGEALCLMQPQSQRLATRKDFLSDADLLSEQMIIQVLAREFPDIPVFAEESNHKPTKKGYVWVIDPVDGTINFFLQDDNWGISIALAKDNTVVAGVIYIPKQNKLLSATIDSPTTLRPIGRNTTKSFPRVNQETDPKLTQFWFGWGKEEHSGADHNYTCRLIEKIDRHSLYPQIRNSAVADMARVAEGKISGYILPRPEPFDFSAAALIIEQAGGKVTDFTGNKWTPFSQTIVASNGALHDHLLSYIQKVSKS